MLHLQAAIEPGKNPHVESRLAMMNIREPKSVDLDRGLAARTEKAIQEGRVHLEKDTVFGPYLGLIEERFRTHFVLPVRRPEEVVESLTHWMDQGFGNAYKEEVPHTFLSPSATELALVRTIQADPNDLSFPRPQAGSVVSMQWNSLSRVGKFAFLWSEMMASILDGVRHLNRCAYTLIDLGLPYEEVRRLLAENLGTEATVSAEDVDFNVRTRMMNSSSRQRPRLAWSHQEWSDFYRFTQPIVERLGEEHGIEYSHS